MCRLTKSLILLLWLPLSPPSRGTPGINEWMRQWHLHQASWADHYARWAEQRPALQASALQWRQIKYFHLHKARCLEPKTFNPSARAPETILPIPAAQNLPTPTQLRSLPWLRLRHGVAEVLSSTPPIIQALAHAANHLCNRPYRHGGGHHSIEDTAYDCSGATSYVLIKARLLDKPLTSAGFAKWGAAGPGRWVTIWVKPGHHVFMTICGLRFDTTGGRVGEGPRWRTRERNFTGFVPRHPHGL